MLRELRAHRLHEHHDALLQQVPGISINEVAG